VRACERKGASDPLRAREMCAAGARYGAARPADACGMRTTARPIRRGAAADACGMRTSGHTRQRVPSRAPTGSRGCPAERLTAAPRHGDTCLIWAEILASAPQHPPGAVICALSTHMCSDVLSASSVARAVFLAVFLLLPSPETCPAMIWRWVGATSLSCNASTHLPVLLSRVVR
jgi:hypothetical protein